MDGFALIIQKDKFYMFWVMGVYEFEFQVRGYRSTERSAIEGGYKGEIGSVCFGLYSGVSSGGGSGWRSGISFSVKSSLTKLCWAVCVVAGEK